MIDVYIFEVCYDGRSARKLAFFLLVTASTAGGLDLSLVGDDGNYHDLQHGDDECVNVDKQAALSIPQ